MLTLEDKKLFERARRSIVRIVVRYQDGKISTGTGFFVSDVSVLSCAHVLFGSGFLSEFLKKQKIPANGRSQHLNRWIRKNVQSITVEYSDGSKADVTKLRYETGYDALFLQVPKMSGTQERLTLSQEPKPFYGDQVWCVGFPDTFGVKSEESPLTLQIAAIRSFASLRLTGTTKHPYIVLDTLCPPGMSGGPVIDPSTGTIIGQIHGYNSWGSDNVLFQHSVARKREQYADALYVPLPITFVTGVDLLQKHLKAAIPVSLKK